MEAYIDLIAEHGLANVTIDNIARRADVSKATLYSRWPDRDALINDTFSHMTTGPPSPTDGSFDEQLADILARVASRGQRFQRLLAEMVLQAAHRPVVRAHLHTFQATWRNGLLELVELGKREGRVPADRNSDRTVEAVMAVTTMRALYGDLPMDGVGPIVIDLLTSERPL